MKKWQFDIQYGQARSPAIGPDGTIYVAVLTESFMRFLEKLVIFSGATPTVRFPSIDFSSNPVLGPDGTVYVGAHDKMVSAFNGQTGDKLWEFETGGIVRSTPALGADGVLYVGSADNKLYALDTADGNKLWEFVAGGPINSSPTLSDDGVLMLARTIKNSMPSKPHPGRPIPLGRCLGKMLKIQAVSINLSQALQSHRW